MAPDGIHHISAITADGAANVAFYVGLLGLRLVKRTVNQEDPRSYHLFYGDEVGSPGSQLTFFVHPRLPRGRAGAGMVHRIIWRVADRAALARWRERLGAAGVAHHEGPHGPVFADPDGLTHELSAETPPGTGTPLIARHREIDPDWALAGLAGVRAYSRRIDAAHHLLEGAMGMESDRDGRHWAIGPRHAAHHRLDPPPAARPLRGAGTVHHVAWTVAAADLEPIGRAARGLGARGLTPVIDRHYFRSLYFSEPGGVLFELATPGPGFTVDEPVEELGVRLALPPPLAHLRPELERSLPALPDIARWRPAA